MSSEENVKGNQELWKEFQKEIQEVRPSTSSTSTTDANGTDILENVKKNINSMIWDWEAIAALDAEAETANTMESQTLNQYGGNWFKKKLEDLRRQLKIPSKSIPVPPFSKIPKKVKSSEIKVKSLGIKVNSLKIEAKPVYQCHICDKKLTRRYGLNRHMLIHSQIRAFECKDCGKKFGQKDNYETHLKLHTGVKPFECQFCDKKFARLATLGEHLKIHYNVRPHQCRFCLKRFCQKAHLNSHARRHTEDIPVLCKYCGEIIKKYNLERHEEIHQDKRSYYKCPVCPLMYKTLSGFDNHYKNKHTGSNLTVLE